MPDYWRTALIRAGRTFAQSFIAVIITARIYSQSDFGNLAVVVGIAGILRVLLTLRYEALIDFVSLSIFIMILGIITALHSTSQASEWKIISNDLNGYNFYTNKFIKGKNF